MPNQKPVNISFTQRYACVVVFIIVIKQLLIVEVLLEPVVCVVSVVNVVHWVAR
jgi:hypothetical protein